MKQFKTVDGHRLKKGDRVWVRSGPDYNMSVRCRLWLGAVLEETKNARTGKVVASHLNYRVDDLDFGTKPRVDCVGDSMSHVDPLIGCTAFPDDCASTKEWWTERVEIQGRVFCVGQNVWIWREGTQPALVRKTVCAIKREPWPVGLLIQCTYEDNYWPRKEDPKKMYFSEKEALEAKPQCAKLLEQALMRAGRRQGFTLRKAA